MLHVLFIHLSKSNCRLVGPYGSGKSQVRFLALRSQNWLNFQQFIDSLSQRTNWANDSLQPKDQSIRSTKVKIKGKGTVILVDTPGFDESTRTAEDILEDVYRWLRRKQVCGKSSTQLKLKEITVTTTPKWQAFYISTTSLRIAWQFHPRSVSWHAFLQTGMQDTSFSSQHIGIGSRIWAPFHKPMKGNSRFDAGYDRFLLQVHAWNDSIWGMKLPRISLNPSYDKSERDVGSTKIRERDRLWVQAHCGDGFPHWRAMKIWQGRFRFVDRVHDMSGVMREKTWMKVGVKLNHPACSLQTRSHSQSIWESDGGRKKYHILLR